MLIIEIKNGENIERALKTLKSKVIKTKQNQKIFQENSIVDLDLRTSGISHGKKSFFNLEVNLFTISEIDFKSNEIKDSVKQIVRNIFKNNIIENKHFEFSISKKDEKE